VSRSYTTRQAPRYRDRLFLPYHPGGGYVSDRYAELQYLSRAPGTGAAGQ